jgi:hypothetical protein
MFFTALRRLRRKPPSPELLVFSLSLDEVMDDLLHRPDQVA